MCMCLEIHVLGMDTHVLYQIKHVQLMKYGEWMRAVLFLSREAVG